jgi:hypothetical protein
MGLCAALEQGGSFGRRLCRRTADLVPLGIVDLRILAPRSWRLPGRTPVVFRAGPDECCILFAGTILRGGRGPCARGRHGAEIHATGTGLSTPEEVL